MVHVKPNGATAALCPLHCTPHPASSLPEPKRTSTWLAGRVTGVRGMDAERYDAPGGATSSCTSSSLPVAGCREGNMSAEVFRAGWVSSWQSYNKHV